MVKDEYADSSLGVFVFTPRLKKTLFREFLSSNHAILNLDSIKTFDGAVRTIASTHIASFFR